MITRDHFAMNYHGYDPAQPFPVGVLAAPRNRAPANVLIRQPTPVLGPAQPHLMMDPLDPSTWQRPYRFTR